LRAILSQGLSLIRLTHPPAALSNRTMTAAPGLIDWSDICCKEYAMRKVLLSLCVLLPLASQARTIEDVTLPESLQVNDATLQLNGAGVRSKYFVDVYVAALYLPALQQDARRIVQADEPQSVRLAIISSRITRD